MSYECPVFLRLVTIMEHIKHDDAVEPAPLVPDDGIDESTLCTDEAGGPLSSDRPKMATTTVPEPQPPQDAEVAPPYRAAPVPLGKAVEVVSDKTDQANPPGPADKPEESKPPTDATDQEPPAEVDEPEDASAEPPSASGGSGNAGGPTDKLSTGGEADDPGDEPEDDQPLPESEPEPEATPEAEAPQTSARVEQRSLDERAAEIVRDRDPKLRPLKRFTLVVYDAPPDAAAQVEHHLLTGSEQYDVQEITDHGLEPQVAAAQLSYVEMAADLHLDVSSRVHSADRLHLYKPEEFSRVLEEAGWDEDMEGFTSLHGDIYVRQDEDDSNIMATVGHELGHLMSHRVLQAHREDLENPMLESEGLMRTWDRAGNSVHEAAIEMMMLEARRNYWPHYPELRTLAAQPFDVGYKLEMVLMDELFATMREPQRVWTALKRGVLDGSKGLAWGRFGDAVGGEEARESLLYMQNPMGVALRLRGTQAFERVRSYQHRPLPAINLFPWM
jgi:hypothetical protein